MLSYLNRSGLKPILSRSRSRSIFLVYLFILLIKIGIIIAQNKEDQLHELDQGNQGQNHDYEFEYDEGEDHKVHLLPPSDVTILFANSSVITIRWDAPLVYAAQFSEITDGYENHTSLDPTTKMSFQKVNTTRNSIDGKLLNKTDKLNSTTNCLPYKTLKKLSEEIWESPTDTVTQDLNSKKNGNTSSNFDVNVVPYAQGCVEKYIIRWQEITSTSTSEVQQLEVPATETDTNISGLKARTNYTITVSSVFVNNMELKSDPILTSTTSFVCNCDWHGSILADIKCNEKRNACDCKPGYSGHFCQICAPGFYRTASFYPCHKCPCQPPSAQTRNCSVYEGFLQCEKCQLGYTGNLCHTCDNGFYRYGKHCIPCRCNGNSMKNATNICHPITGSCLHCFYNTTGFNCERCLDGYVGDAIKEKNCTLRRELITYHRKDYSSLAVGIVLGVFIFLGLIVAVIILIRRYNLKGKRWSFFSVEIKCNESDFHCVSGSYDHEPDVIFYGTKLKCSNKYVKLHEEH